MVVLPEVPLILIELDLLLLRLRLDTLKILTNRRLLQLVADFIASIIEDFRCNVLLFCRHTCIHFLALACTKTQLRASATNLL